MPRQPDARATSQKAPQRTTISSAPATRASATRLARCPRAEYRVTNAQRLLGQRRALLAMGELSRAITEDPRCGAAYLELARLRAGLGDYGEAELLYEKAIRLPPVASEALRARSLMRRRQGKTRQALRDLEAYAALAPSDPSRLEILATVYIELRSWPAALAVYRRILHLHESALREREATNARIKVRALSLLTAEADPVTLGASSDRSWVRRAMAHLAGLE